MRTRSSSIGRSIVIATAVVTLLAMLAPAVTARPAHRDAGDVWVQVRSAPVHVPGSPYGWRFTFSRFEQQGMPAGNWDLTVEANRAVKFVRAGG